jgi:hypothetical protein
MPAINEIVVISMGDIPPLLNIQRLFSNSIHPRILNQAWQDFNCQEDYHSQAQTSITVFLTLLK